MAKRIRRLATDEEIRGSIPLGGTIGGSSDSADDLLSYMRARIAKSSRLEVGSDQPGAFASIVQWIEYRFPKPATEVQLFVEALC